MNSRSAFDDQPSRSQDDVAQFFADARAAVVAEPVSDDGWARVVGQSRGPFFSRRNWHAYVAGAAAAVVALFGVWSWQQQPMGSSNVVAGRGVSGPDATNFGSTGTTQSAPVVSAVQDPGKVPLSFVTWSLSNAGKGTLYNLGSASCAAVTCPTLLRSSDDGTGWSRVHVFGEANMSSAAGSDIPQIQPERAISQVRFASPRIGYVFGGDLWATTDSGASFTKVTHPGETVLDVEVSQEQVEILSADNCAQGVCAGPLYLSHTGNGAVDIRSAAHTYELPHPISAGSLVVKDDSLGVDLTAADDSEALAPLRLQGSELVPIAPIAACGKQPPAQLTAASNEVGMWWGLCNPRVSGSQITYTVLRSVNAGQSWVVGGQVSVPRLGQPTITAADSDHVVVASGGPRDPGGPAASDPAGALQVSSNGGRTFRPASAQTALPPTGFDWVGSPGGNDVYAIARTQPGYWVSHNLGATWDNVAPS